MKKRAKYILILMISVLLALIVYTLINTFILSKYRAKRVLPLTLNAITECDFTNNFFYTNQDGYIKKYLNLNPLLYCILQECAFEPVSYDFNQKSDFGTVELRAKYPDVYSVYSDIFSKVDREYTTNEIQSILIEKINDGNFNMITDTIKVNIIRNHNDWYLIENENLLNIYTGGIYNEINNMVREEGENGEKNN